MKRLMILGALCTAIPAIYAQSSLRVNQMGYLCNDFKSAVYVGDMDPENIIFEIVSPERGKFELDSVADAPAWAPFKHAARIYFSSVTTPGEYVISARRLPDGAVMDVAKLYIGNDAYSRLAIHEMPLNYLRQQRCGYNPVHDAECHQHDGFLVLSGDDDGKHYDVRGGWHDASDYLQYLPTSANTVYQLLFAYKKNPDVWADNYDAAGKNGSNGVPDILDEARWGLEWMCRMNPEDNVYLNQIADDRDHRYAGVPQKDSVDYGRGPGAGRPVYPVSGEPYGLMKNKNRSTGEASSVAKFASAFALGSKLFQNSDPDFAKDLASRAEKAYAYAKAHPGASQTAPCVSPYFYEEDNWVDDVELAGAQLSRLLNKPVYEKEAAEYGAQEPCTPWMGADTARHYQWYPFVNLGHALLAESSSPEISTPFKKYLKDGVERVAKRGESNAFRYGVPFIWCSNNLAVAFVTQAMLYRELTGDNTYIEAETAARDWLFGVNPWGQTMIILPDGMVESSPVDPHSAMVDLVVNRRPGRDWLVGGIVDGPVYTGIFNSLWGVHLRHDDRFAHAQGPVAVYHDDYSDYSTNEPTMDGTASLTFMLSRLIK
ncbi:MAG: glycoside hydrolase family 9 protein [Muribaculaceae bacterium]|nr:glycoside hydrolase family 9 protein [Muribaculaceae bacterium]